jgi:hypothetical protein
MRMRVWVRVVYPDEDSRFGDRQDGEKAGAARRVSTSAGANPRSRWTGNLDSHRLVENGERHASAFVFAPAASRGRVCENEVAQGSASVLGPEQAGSMCPLPSLSSSLAVPTSAKWRMRHGEGRGSAQTWRTGTMEDTRSATRGCEGDVDLQVFGPAPHDRAPAVRSEWGARQPRQAPAPQPHPLATSGEA